MFQPFLEFTETYVDRLIKLNKKVLVSQTYGRYTDHFSDHKKTGILLTDYDDMGLAKMHLKAVSADRFAAIIMLENDNHKQKIVEMLQPDSKYRVFWSVVNRVHQMEERLKRKYSSNIARYISKSTTWHIGKDEQIIVGFQVTYGELYITIKRGSHSIRVKFDEVEKA